MNRNNYIYQQDGKIHTRFSELKLCTPKQIDRLIAIKNRDLDPFVSEHMAFGTDRHSMFEDEAKRTRKLPKCFHSLPSVAKVDLDEVEKEYAVELVRGVVVHSRPDAISKASRAIFDYKTALE